MTQDTTQFIPDNDQTRARREHLDGLRELVGNVYPNKFGRTNVAASGEGEDTISAIVAKFKRHEPPPVEGARPAPELLEAANAELRGLGEVRVGGRLATPPRVMGKAGFVHLSDGQSRLQIYVRRDEARAVHNDTGETIAEPESGWRLFQLLDHGDFAGVAGHLFVTKTGELSVHVREIQFLSKALVPMPDKIHGISDPEIGRRQRYVDLIASGLKVKTKEEEEEERKSQQRNYTTREVFELRSRLITQMRAFLDAHGYIEVETPMLTPLASGAAARPFETHHNALDIKLYARIAPELYLKRLLVGGFERVYELNRNFRNEGIGYRWNPEFTMLEFYCAYMDVNGMMDFCEEMLRTAVEHAAGTTRLKFDDEEIDFSKFERLTMKQAIARHWRFKTLGGENFEGEWLQDSAKLNRLYVFEELLHAVKVSPTLVAADGLHSKEWHRNRQAEFEARIENERKDEIWRESLTYIDSIPSREEAERLEIADFAYATLEYVYEQLDKFESADSREAYIVEKLFEDFAEKNLTQPTFIMDFPKPISPLSKASPADPSVAERFELFVAGMEIANGFSELNDPVEQGERFDDQARQRERGDDEAMQRDDD
ncbi:MAG: lysine--tRNA ligase [Acidobacteria bacterium]|nr:lysine--tRNA ligase [Acidobacteriota bacterium]